MQISYKSIDSQVILELFANYQPFFLFVSPAIYSIFAEVLYNPISVQSRDVGLVKFPTWSGTTNEMLCSKRNGANSNLEFLTFDLSFLTKNVESDLISGFLRP